MRWPLYAGNNNLDYRSYAGWVRQPTSALETLVAVGTGTNGASALQYRVFLETSRRIRVDHYTGAGVGRRATSAVNAIPAAGTWFWYRVRYNKNGGAAEDDIAQIWINGVNVGPLTFANIGAGSPLANGLVAANGNALIGNLNDGVSSVGLNASLGPNLFSLSADLTSTEEANLMAFEAPT